MKTQQVKIIIVHRQKTREWHAGKEHGFIGKVLSVNVGVCVCVRTWRLWVSMRWCVSMWCIHVGMCTSLSHRELIPNTNISSYSELWKKIPTHTLQIDCFTGCVCVCVLVSSRNWVLGVSTQRVSCSSCVCLCSVHVHFQFKPSTQTAVSR